MPLRTISSGRVAAGTLWTPQTTFDLMERSWQAFEVPFDWELAGTFAATATASGTSYDTHDLYCVFPDSYDVDVNFSAGMYVELSIFAYMTHTTGGVTTLAFTGETGDSSLTSAWLNPKKPFASGSIPTGIQTLELTLTVKGLAPATGNSAITRAWGDSGPDSFLRIVIPDAGGIDTDDVIIYVGDESELPAASVTWRHAEARLNAKTNKQDVVWRCLKGYDDVYYWRKFVVGGGPFDA